MLTSFVENGTLHYCDGNGDLIHSISSGYIFVQIIKRYVPIRINTSVIVINAAL